MIEQQNIIITATSEREAVGELVRQHAEVMEANKALRKANEILRKQLSIACQRIRLLELQE